MKFYLSGIRSKDDLKRIFIEEWNWENPKINRKFFDFSSEIKNDVIESEILADKLGYQILFFRVNLKDSDKNLKRIERGIVNHKEIKEILDRSVLIFADNNFDYLDFIKAEKVGSGVKIKRFSIAPDNRDKLRTPSEQLEKLKLDSVEVKHSTISNSIEEAFSVEVVSDGFYEGYMEVFESIRKELIKQKVNIEKLNESLRDFIHQTLNRIMFLYFVQKRGCFNGDKNFLGNFWDAYKDKFMGENKFHKEWLNNLFFEALSKPSWLYQPKESLGEFNEILKNAPYLNGGLFEKNDLDNRGWQISDNLFENIFEFFESYNFTIEESTRLDIDIAINPEMLGNIYEHLVSVDELTQEQRKAGIFYTPKVEIEFMIRRALVEYLYQKIKIDKVKLYQFVFPEEGIEVEDPFTQQESEKVLKNLEDILILDPACGSGHYLVVAAQTLYELKKILWKKLNIHHSKSVYEEKKKIIERNIYGNDIKKWATEIAKLRLWLDLFIYAEGDILKDQSNPLLPNLNFKIRYGDSLVQRIGSDIVILRNVSKLFRHKKDELKNLINKKKACYENRAKPDEVLLLEKKLLQNSISDRIRSLKQQEQNTRAEIKKLEGELKKENKDLFGGKTNNVKLQEQLQKEIEEKQKKIEEIIGERQKLKKFYDELTKATEPPMIWDLSFAEVFQMKNGFDIVIANPPYVRQELIDDLTGFYSKKEYKEKLIQQIRQDWNYDYDGKPITSPIPQKFDKKCDLYVYFYLKGLKLLNPDGVLCYISSNSWLDVEYGRVLQEVLLKRCPIIAIYDNQVKRSFKHADVNTIIAIIKAPKEKDFDEEIRENEVKFVMFKKPFEEVMYSEVFIELENTDNLKQLPEGKRRETELYRLHVVNQKDLYEFGKDKNTGQYIGNKWGGKYLRAPEIYWVILEKGKDKLVKLGDIAEVRFGIKTGANDFFYVEDITDEIIDE